MLPPDSDQTDNANSRKERQTDFAANHSMVDREEEAQDNIAQESGRADNNAPTDEQIKDINTQVLSSLISTLKGAIDSQTLVLNLQLPPGKIPVDLYLVELPRKRLRRFLNFVKDFVPVLTAIATITVTIIVSYYGYQLNMRQATATQIDLRTKVLSDFIENDDKRMLAAIKLAEYGEEALPSVKQSLGADNDKIRAGGIETAKQMYAEPTATLPHAKMIDVLLSYLESKNRTLRVGVMMALVEVAELLDDSEAQRILEYLKTHLDSRAQSCFKEDQDFVLYAAKFIGASKPFPGSIELLLGIAQNCPAEKKEEEALRPYDGARKQVPASLKGLAEKLPKPDRNVIINSLRDLETKSPEDFKIFIETAIKDIQNIPETVKP
jgi:hypothetical protein